MSVNKRNQHTTKEAEVNYPDLFDRIIVAFNLAKKERVLEEIKRISRTPEETSKLIYWFFPSITFRLLFPRLKYKEIDKYTIINSDGSKEVFLFSENIFFIELYKYLNNISDNFSRRKIFRVLEHSIEFRMVNDAINNGDKIDDIVIVSEFKDF